MSKYTIELGELVRSGFRVFNDSWNTFDPSHKEELCQKIINRYWFYELGQETPEMFRFYINEQLMRIMPYYNQLYASELLKLEPLYNMFMEQTEDSVEGRDRKADRTGLTANSRLVNMCKSLRELMVGNEISQGNIDFTGDIIGTDIKKTTENETTETDKTTERTQNETTARTEDETDNRTIKEVMNEEIEGTKDITSHTDTTNSSERYYSDTPQTQVTGDEVEVSKSYLTNYTEEHGSGTEDQTSNEKINTTTNRTTDTTDNLTKDIKEDITKDTTENIEETENETRNLTRDEDRKTTENTVENTKDVKKTDTASDTQNFENGSTREGFDETKNETEKELENTTNNRKMKYKGFNVDQSTLLIRFRETFLNIDADIISAVGNNFMEVF